MGGPAQPSPRRRSSIGPAGAPPRAPWTEIVCAFGAAVKPAHYARAVRDLPRVLDARGLELVGHTDLDGKGDGMQIMRNGDVVYVGHMGDSGVATSVVDVSDLRHPKVVAQLP